MKSKSATPKAVYRLFLVLVAVVAVMMISSCGGEDKSIPAGGTNNTDGDVETTEGNEGTDTEAQCTYAEDCAENEDCVNGQCVKANLCFGDNSECNPDEICDKRPWNEKGYCRKACATDMDCPEDGQCMNGVCERYEPLPEADPLKDGSESKKPLMGALAKVPLDFPMGVTLGGFGTRMGPPSPYSDKMGGSSGMYDRPYIKTLMLDNGEDAVILVRVSLIFPTDFLVTGVVKKVIEETGKDITRNLIITGTHTHSMPARFWNLLPGMGFGALGMDEFSWEIYQRIVNSIASSIIEAMNNLHPVALGYGIDPNFDPEDLVSRDRRQENDPIDGGEYKDPRLFMLRVDDLTDEQNPRPMATIINFAAHGTINGVRDSQLTQDTGGGVELMFQHFFAKDTGKHIEAMFMQGMAGDVSPGGDKYGHKHQQTMQMLGTFLYPKAKALYDSIQTSRDIDMEIVTKRIPIDRNHIGYTDNEFMTYDILAEGCKALNLSDEECASHDQDELLEAGCNAVGMEHDYCIDNCLTETEPYGPLRFGGFQCGLFTTIDDDDINTRMWDGCLGCVLKIAGMNLGPMPQFSKTRLSALRINDLVVAILPGEPMSKMGAEYVDLIKQDAKDKTGKDYEAVIWGYSNDHHFYLLLEDDWYQGGYEPSMSIWGPKFGDYLLSQGKDLVDQLFTPEKEDNSNNIKPLNYKASYIDMCLSVNGIGRWRTPDPTDSNEVGTIETQPPAQYERMTKFRIHWIGGDPGVDVPYVILQRQNENGDFEDYKTETGEIYDDSGYSMQLDWENPCLNDRRYPRCGDNPNVNNWYLTFEERKDFELGTYRFKIVGHYYTGDADKDFDESKVEQYEITTNAFEVVPNTHIKLFDITFDDASSTLSGAVAYPSGPTTDPGAGEVFDGLSATGLLVHCPETKPVIGCKIPVDDIASIEVDLGNEDKITEATYSIENHSRKLVTARDGDGNETLTDFGEWPTTLFTVDLTGHTPITEQVTITITDKYGNTGVGIYMPETTTE